MNEPGSLIFSTPTLCPKRRVEQMNGFLGDIQFSCLQLYNLSHDQLPILSKARPSPYLHSLLLLYFPQFLQAWMVTIDKVTFSSVKYVSSWGTSLSTCSVLLKKEEILLSLKKGNYSGRKCKHIRNDNINKLQCNFPSQQTHGIMNARAQGHMQICKRNLR